MKEVVTIGGGTGSYTLLRGLKAYQDLHLTAIVSMMDNGGSSGILRDEHGVLPPGDVRQAIIALSDETELLKQVFEYRFPQGEGFLADHNLGNIILTGLMGIANDPAQGIEYACKIMKVHGRVLPVTTQSAHLHAILEDGSEIVGETNIDIPKHDPSLRIERVFLEPRIDAHLPALEAIVRADYVVIGPGDLYTSIIPNFLAKGVPEAMLESHARKIYVCNVMTKHGETDWFTATDFLDTVEKYLGGVRMDDIVVNTALGTGHALGKYLHEHATPVSFDPDELSARGVRVTAADVRYQNGLIRHDSAKIAATLHELMAP